VRRINNQGKPSAGTTETPQETTTAVQPSQNEKETTAKKPDSTTAAATTTVAATEEKKGCGSVISVGALAVGVALGGVVLFKRKKED